MKFTSILAFLLLALPALAEPLVSLSFDDADSDGIFFRDDSGNGHHLKMTEPLVQSSEVPPGAPPGSRSLYNEASALGGFGGDIQESHRIRLDTQAAFTIEGWVRWKEGAGGLCRIKGENLMIWLAWSADGELYVTHGRGTVAKTGVRLPRDEWVHLAYTFGQGQFTIYFNAEEQTTGEVTAEDSAALGNSIATINLLEADGALLGWVDDFRIFDNALSPEALGYHRRKTP